MVLDIDGYGETEVTATAYTLVVYEQEFGGDLIREVFGKHEVESDGKATIDFTTDNWNAELKALWAMVVTAYDLKASEGLARPADRPKPFREWVRGVGKVNFYEISQAVVTEAMDGFFHTGAAASS